jgi:hypothetical protein
LRAIEFDLQLCQTKDDFTANRRRINKRVDTMADLLPEPRVDGLALPEVGAWTEDKHRLVSLYTALFSKGMKKKWDKRIYVELYAGAGIAGFETRRESS